LKQIIPEIPLYKHQLEFINSPHRYNALVGGFGCGKTLVSICKADAQLKKRDNKGLIIYVAPTYQLANDVNIPDFEEFYDHFKVRYKVKRAEHKILLTSKNFKGEIWFRSGEKPERIVGFNATDFIIDEFDILRLQQQEVLWRKLIARIRKCNDATGSIVTTPEGFKKTYDLCITKKIVNRIKGKTVDNTSLPEDYIADLYNQYDPELVKQYLEGEFVNIKGRKAYYAFSRGQHVIKTEEINTSRIHIGMDFNVDPMTATLGVYISGKLIIFDEYYLKDSNTTRMCQRIKEDYPDMEIVVYPDMTGIKRGTAASTGVTDLTIIKQAGFNISGSRNPFVRDRLNTVNGALSNDKIFIMDKCEFLIRDLEQVVTDTYGEIDKSNSDLTHSSDGFGYKVCRLFPIKHKRRKVS
jgi:PBSX family phage terminase large subunit